MLSKWEGDEQKAEALYKLIADVYVEYSEDGKPPTYNTQSWYDDVVGMLENLLGQAATL